MSIPAHRIERRAAMLAQGIQRRTGALADMLRAPNDRPLFTERLPQQEALDWWKANRTNEFGQRVIDRWYASDPVNAMVRVQELDAALNDAVERDRMYGVPVPPQEGGPIGPA